MRIYKCGIIGHKSHRLADVEFVKRQCLDAVLMLTEQYPVGQLCINVNGNSGCNFWVADACRRMDVNYHIYLPYAFADLTAEWSEADKIGLAGLMDSCYGLSIAGREADTENICRAQQALVDNSDFIIAFWEGYRYGLVYETLKYGLGESRLVLDGLGDFSLITRRDVKRTSGDGE